MDLDVWFKEKRGFKNILFQLGLIKWVGNEAIGWNRDPGFTGQADGRWRRSMLSLRYQLSIQKYMWNFIYVLSSGEKPDLIMVLRSHQNVDVI